MVESLAVTRTADRGTRFEEILPQIKALVESEPDLTANLANIAAVLKEAFDFFWVGFYIAKGKQLVLGPFQGPLACTRIGFSEGVCGRSYSNNETVIVPNVDEFPGHIACSSASRSEIVVPIQASDGQPIGVLDVDSDKLDDFSQTDAYGLERVAAIISETLTSRPTDQ